MLVPRHVVLGDGRTVNVPESTAALIADVRAGGRCYDAILRSMARTYSPGPDLTARELDVVRLLADGHTQPQIAALTSRSHWTVRDQSGRARVKLEARTNAQLVAAAFRLGLID